MYPDSDSRRRTDTPAAERRTPSGAGALVMLAIPLVVMLAIPLVVMLAIASPEFVAGAASAALVFAARERLQ